MGEMKPCANTTAAPIATGAITAAGYPSSSAIGIIRPTAATEVSASAESAIPRMCDSRFGSSPKRRMARNPRPAWESIPKIAIRERAIE